jgi:hypothetical protein
VTRPTKQEIAPVGEIDPGRFYRTTLSPAIFGIGWQACRNKILANPPQLPIPSGDPAGWTGQQILDHRAKMDALAEKKAAANASRPKQSQPATLVGKRKKTTKKKLRAPSQRGKQSAHK